MKLLSKAEQSKTFWFLLITSFIFFVLRLPSLFEPYWYGDEGIYQVIGAGLRHGRILYEGVWDNKPPLLYLVYAVFNAEQFYTRLASLIFGLFSVIGFYFLSKRIFGENKKQKVISILTTSFFAFFLATPLIEGNIANAENFLIFPIILAALFIYKEEINSKTYFISGTFLGLAFLFKIVAIFDFAAFLIFAVILNTNFEAKKTLSSKTIRNFIKPYSPLILGFVIPICISSIFFLGRPFKYFLEATFFQNIGYVGWGNELIIPQGYLILKLILLFSSTYYLISRKNKFSKTFLFILLWLSFSIFNAFFSQRPYTHYLLVLLPSFSLLLGLVLWERKNKTITVAVLIISVLLIFSGFRLVKKTSNYYQNFISFITNNKSVSDYRGYFDKNTPIDYEVASYIRSKTDEKDYIFVWGNNAQIYKLTGKLPPGRYAVAYHITGYKEGISNTQEALNKTNPKFIIIMPNQPIFPFSLNGYGNVVMIEKVLIYERIF